MGTCNLTYNFQALMEIIREESTTLSPGKKYSFVKDTEIILGKGPESPFACKQNQCSLPNSSLLTEEETELILDEIVYSSLDQAACLFYCPFCPLRYKRKLSLKLHIRQSHLCKLNGLAGKNFSCQSCPICGANFYSDGIFIRHFTTYHSQVIADSWMGLTRSRKNPECTFCSLRFPDSKTNTVLRHFFEKHGEEFEKYIYQLAKDGLTNNGMQQVLPDKRSDLRTSAKRRLRFSVPEAVCHLYDRDSPSVTQSREDTNEGEREKEFSNNDTDQHMNNENYPATPIKELELSVNVTPKRGCLPLCKKSHSPKPKYTSTPLRRRKRRVGSSLNEKVHFLFHTKVSPHSPKNRIYRCNLCRSRFVNNQDLVQHIKTTHSSLHFQLKPAYSCGACTAQFYSKEFLFKHCNKLHLALINQP